jgi:hypothetical protein
MARGWESKSAEAQAEMAEARRVAILVNTPTPQQLALIRKKESILLSRVRVETDLKSAQNPRYKELLNKALADLDAQLSTLAGGSAN